MKTWRRFRALSASDRLLVVEAASLLLFVRTGLSLLPFSTVRRMLRAIPRSERRSSPESARRVGWAVTSTAAQLPVRTTCLTNALAGEAMFTRRGWPCDLRFGVQRPDHHDFLEAHSWIEHDGCVVLGAIDNLHSYGVLTSEDGQ
jgi:hypothetical protein